MDRDAHARRANAPQTTSTMIAPTVAPMNPALCPSWYHPIAWPRKVATNAPAMPSRVVRMKPDGSLGPGWEQFCNHAGDEADNDRPDDAHAVFSAPLNDDPAWLVPTRGTDYAADPAIIAATRSRIEGGNGVDLRTAVSM